MHWWIVAWTLLWSCLFFASPSYADIRFTHLLSEAHQMGEDIGGTTNILQDKHGFVWVAGENGVIRYDGINTKRYIHDPTKSSLVSNFTRDMLVDHKGVLWVGTDLGLCYLDQSIDNFRCFIHTTDGLSDNAITSLALGADGTLFVGTSNGLNRLNPDRTFFSTLFVRQPNSEVPPLNHVSTLFIDGYKLWIGTVDNGFGIYDIQTDELDLFLYEEGSENSVSYPHIKHFLKDLQGQVWISTYGGGIDLFNQDHNTFSTYRHNPNNANSIGSDVIWKGFQDSEGIIWFATDHGGLAKYNPEKDNFKNYRHNPYNSTSLSSDQVRTIYEDLSGNLWIGTFPQGINYVNRSAQSFEHWSVQAGGPKALTHSAILSLLEDHQGHIWVGTENGLNRFNPQTQSFTHYLPQKGVPGHLQAGPILSIAEGPNKNLWIGTWSGGLHVYERTSNSFRHFPINKKDPHAARDEFIWQLLWKEDKNRLYIATESNGLAIYNQNTNKFDYHKHNIQDRKSISSDFVLNLLFDSEDNLWLITEDGFDRFDEKNGNFARYKSNLTTENISPAMLELVKFRSLAHDQYDRLWVGSENNGVFIFNPKTNTTQHLDLSKGLPSNFISSIAIDLLNQAWITTPSGVARIQIDDLSQVSVFSKYDGLAGNHYNRNATLVDSQGRVYLGSIDGVSRFYPHQVHNTLLYSPVKIQNFRILNQSIKPGDPHSPLTQPILDTRALTLQHQHSMITFEYVAVNFSAPNSFEYAYKLEGFDQDWNYVDQKRFATYTNLSQGSYSFKVKAKPDNGVWQEQATQIDITVLPPPWLTLWAFGLYAVVALCLIAFLIRLQNKRLELKAEKSLNSQLIRLNKIKDSFLANTSHELRTPLNGIIGIAESICEEFREKLDKELVNKLHFIAQSGKRLSSLINDILDYSKLGRNKLNIFPKAVNLYSTTECIFTLLQPLAKDKNLRLINDVDKTLPYVFADENRLQQILMNLVGNAIKYTDKGFIKVLATIQDQHMRIRISDSGIGIAQKDLARIFDAFHQVEDHSLMRKGGTGLGLAVTKELVELQGGKIWVHSRKQVGTTFTFTIPINRAKPSKVEVKESPSKLPKFTSKAMNQSVYSSDHTELSTPKLNICSPPELAKETTILIVDDDPVNRMVLRSMLQLHCYNIIEAKDGLEALNKVAQNSIDLVILDIMMPKMSGFEVCESLRKIFPIHKLPILFLTAKKVDEDVSKGFSVGGNEFFTKPISKYEILPRVANHVRLLNIYRNLTREVSSIQ